MSQLLNRINAALLNHGRLLDLAYSQGYNAFHARDVLRERAALLRPVSFDELAAYLPESATHYLEVHVTTRCNAQCSFCVYRKVVRAGTLTPTVMDLGLFKKVVSEFGALGGTRLCLTPLVGEALLDPYLYERIDFALHEAGLQSVFLCTNGILLDRDDNFKRLVDSGIDELDISTQGTNRAAFEAAYGVDKYDTLIAGVAHLFEYNKSKGEPLRIRIRFRNSQKPSEIVASQDYIKHIRPYLSQRVQASFTVRYCSWGGTIQQHELPAGMRLSKAARHVNLPCVNLLQLAVTPSGHVRMCGCVMKHTDVDDLVIGNVELDTLEHIVRGPRALEVIQGFYDGTRPDVCSQCEMYVPVTRRMLNG